MTNTPNIETEIKIRVADPQTLTALATRITQIGGALVAPRIWERNIRYEDAGGTLTPAQRVLRLRQDSRARLTYKEPRPESGLARTEIEIEVSDFDQTALLLGKLGFRVAWAYEKYRTTYHVSGCEVVLDETPIGAFVEIEGPNAAAIFTVMEQIGLGGRPYLTTSYSDLFFALRERLNLPFTDLTFANFAAVSAEHVAAALAELERDHAP